MLVELLLELRFIKKSTVFAHDIPNIPARIFNDVSKNCFSGIIKEASI